MDGHALSLRHQHNGLKQRRPELFGALGQRPTLSVVSLLHLVSHALVPRRDLLQGSLNFSNAKAHW